MKKKEKNNDGAWSEALRAPVHSMRGIEIDAVHLSVGEGTWCLLS